MNQYTTFSIRDQSCPNTYCAYYGKTSAGNIVFHGRKYPRLKCKECGKTWVLHHADPSYRLRKTKEQLEQFFRLSRSGLSIREIAKRVKVTPGTILRWKKKLLKTHPSTFIS